MKAWNSVPAFNAQCLRVIIVVVQVGAVNIYIYIYIYICSSSGGAQGKGKTGWNLVNHQNRFKN